MSPKLRSEYLHIQETYVDFECNFSSNGCFPQLFGSVLDIPEHIENQAISDGVDGEYSDMLFEWEEEIMIGLTIKDGCLYIHKLTKGNSDNVIDHTIVIGGILGEFIDEDYCCGVLLGIPLKEWWGEFDTKGVYEPHFHIHMKKIKWDKIKECLASVKHFTYAGL
ncbi:MAG: hypothetical protein WCO00_09580 [Rhodospirillaceae bacterium]